MERLDIAHNLFFEAFGRLHHAPIREPVTESSETRVLDLGAGTGIWAIDMADIPPNLRFRVPRDYESMWSLGHDSFDLIYLRLACGGVSSWTEIYSKILQHLKPGIGWLEQVEIDFEPRCDDGPVPARLSEWYQWLMTASESGGKSLRYDRQTPRILDRLGFADVSEVVIKLPLNDWATQEPARSLGRWNSVVFNGSVEALSLGPFTRVNQWSLRDVKRLCEEVKALGLNRKVHCYQTM